MSDAIKFDACLLSKNIATNIFSSISYNQPADILNKQSENRAGDDYSKADRTDDQTRQAYQEGPLSALPCGQPSPYLSVNKRHQEKLDRTADICCKLTEQSFGNEEDLQQQMKRIHSGGVYMPLGTSRHPVRESEP
ncbi:hypothetical protein T265_12153 [Opisthorchis viverrini]|uniref:Uncharacterized protein n=1 Tax=Opisthorchis viverrini TaxID=6198 RepID=A0A074ZUB6_OPIVI|nr:hypothetical protein T265_12153 [Opisthorchis viverrini]KER18794.1 hypothetical protein T265_12153 [Opisthorchis viverrini]